MSTAAVATSNRPSNASTTPRVSSNMWAWLLFAPPVALVGLRHLLEWQTERTATMPVLALSPFAGTQDPWAWLPLLGWAVLGVTVASVLARALRRRWGTRALQCTLAGAWVLLCAAGAAASLWGFFNVQHLQPLAPVQAQLLGSRAKAPSVRGPGGTVLVLQVDGMDAPQQLLVDDPQVAQWLPGQRMQLQWARGRSSGHFVTGWQVLAADAAPATAVPAAPAQAGPLLP